MERTQLSPGTPLPARCRTPAAAAWKSPPRCAPTMPRRGFQRVNAPTDATRPMSRTTEFRPAPLATTGRADRISAASAAAASHGHPRRRRRRRCPQFRAAGASTAPNHRPHRHHEQTTRRAEVDNRHSAAAYGHVAAPEDDRGPQPRDRHAEGLPGARRLALEMHEPSGEQRRRTVEQNGVDRRNRLQSGYTSDWNIAPPARASTNSGPNPAALLHPCRAPRLAEPRAPRRDQPAQETQRERGDDSRSARPIASCRPRTARRGRARVRRQRGVSRPPPAGPFSVCIIVCCVRTAAPRLPPRVMTQRCWR